MKPGPKDGERKRALRRKAEEAMQSRASGPDHMPEEDVRQLIHELQVHQIELEMQNEALQQAQEELATSRDRYFDLFDLAPLGYFMLDEDSRILDVNLAGADLLGQKRSELTGRRLAHFVYEQDQDAFFRLRRQAFQNRERMDGEIRLLKADGKLFYAHLDFVRTQDQSAQANQLRLIVKDVSERVILEQRLVKSATIFHAAERIAHVGGWEWDIEKDVVTLTDELQRIYGCEKASYPMASFLLLAHPEDRAAKSAVLKNALSGENELRCDYRIIRQNDQAERNILMSGEVITNLAGQPVIVYGASQDVTELKMNERALKTYAKHLESLNNDLESFTYIASHDLQEPLRKILQFGNSLKNNPSLGSDEQAKNYIDRMQSAAKRMSLLIDDLLRFSRAANSPLSLQTVCLNVIVKEALDDLEIRIRACGGQVEVGELPTLSADPIQMRQLFQNLIGNALKFHKEGEAPVVRVESSLVSPGMVEIRVIDQGIGFDEQHVEKIFQPFERLHGRSKYEGSGIGLAICRKIVERHAGTITARSKPGKGATFIVTLPVDHVT